MGKQNGLIFADLIHDKFPHIQIVFVTAHDEYAVKAFEIESLDYLLKPVTSTRLKKTIERIIGSLDLESKAVEESPSKFVIHCFNEFQFLKDNLPISFKTVKVKELFAFFVIHQNKPIHRDVLIESLWPNQDYNKSKINFHTCLSHLRKLLKGFGFDDCIILVNHSYVFTMENVAIDVQQFEELYKSIDTVNESTIATAEKCVELYKGPLFDLNHYDWAESYSLKLTNDYAILLENLADYFAKKDQNKMLFYLQQQLPLFPYNDEKVEHCMELLYKHSYRNEAIKLYVEYAERLDRDLKITPYESLQKLYNQIVADNLSEN